MADKPTPTSIRLSPDERAVITLLAREDDRSEGDTIRRLAAEGLKALILRDNRALAWEEIVPIVSPAEVARTYLEWRDGHATRAGLEGPLGNRFTLAEGPDGYRVELNPEFSAWPPEREMFALCLRLQSADLRERLEAGMRLMAGSGQHLGPAIQELIGRAVGGGEGAAEAVEELLKASHDAREAR